VAQCRHDEVPVTSWQDVALMRLVAQRVAGPPSATPAAAVHHLLAVQGQDLPGGLLSVALRSAGGTRAAVEAALDAGDVVRSWPMRGTLHLVAAEDLGWLRDLCVPRVLPAFAARRQRLGLTDADTERAAGLAAAALSGGRRLGRVDLVRALADGGVPTDGQRGYHLLGYLAHTGLLCLGPTDGAGEQLFVLAAEWLPLAPPRDRDEALAELALRYLRGHGPATVADLARWSGLRVTDVRAGTAAVRDQLATVEVDGTELLLDPATPDALATHRAAAAGLHLLPGFDEVVLGYADRSCTVPPEHAERIVPGGNGMFRATVVVGGRVVGTWRWARRGRVRTLAAEPFDDLPPAVSAALAEAGAALAARAEPASPAPGGTPPPAGGG
jgi:Winged helix DNA-binding domain